MRLLQIILSVILLAAGWAQADEGIFDIGGRPATSAIIARAEVDPSGFLTGSDMLMQLTGAMAVFEGGQLNALRRCVPANPGFIGRPDDVQRVCIIYLFRGKLTKRIEIIRTVDRIIIAQEMDSSAKVPPRVELRRKPFEELLADWPIYEGGFEIQPLAGPRIFDLEKPYTPSPFNLNEQLVIDRFYSGRRTKVRATERDLTSETLRIRLPQGYDPKNPAGLIVWIDPLPESLIRQELFRACNKLGLICITAKNSGNNRLVTDRYQLALDAVATVSSRYHIDPRRVYISGMSGGGRVCSTLVACFPDVFTGAVPIVGLSSYKRVPTGTGKYWPYGYLRPAPALFRLFKTRPIAAMTGKGDFNFNEMSIATRIMQADGVNIKLFTQKLRGHQMPNPDKFLEAIQWVEQPYTRQRAEEVADAQTLLKRTSARFGDDPAATIAGRKLLIKVTQVGPWTDAAWEAAGALLQSVESP